MINSTLLTANKLNHSKSLPEALQMTQHHSKPGDWQVDVKFQSKGVLQASASGLLLVPPGDVLALVTDPGAGRGLTSDTIYGQSVTVCVSTCWICGSGRL